jgi:hypothetical protein
VKIRIDINHPYGKNPELVGLWLQGFGWVLGGIKNGKAAIRAELRLEKDFRFNALDLATTKRMMNRMEKSLTWPNMGKIVRPERDDD